MSTGACLLARAAIFLIVFLIAVQVIDAGTATAETPKATFTGTVYYKNYVAAGATVSVSYAMQTYSTTADEHGNYSLTIDYYGNGSAILTASYNGDMDVFTWYLDGGTRLVHDFWITPRPGPSASEGPAATFQGYVYYSNRSAQGAHVILVYGKYVLDQYTNDTGYYDLTIYYQGMPGRIWATYGDGRSEDYWPNPGMGGTSVTDIYIAPMTGIPTATPAPTSGATVTPAPEVSPTASPVAKPAGMNGIESLMVSAAAMAIVLVISRRK